eukprot:CFRG6635T1
MWSVLEISGATALVCLAYALTQIISPLITNTDNRTAWTRLPADAFKNKVVWITGASSGLGLEMTLQLAKQGAKLIISSRRENVLYDVVESCRKVNPECDVHVLPLDLEDIDSLDTKARIALSIYDGSIDVLINNGGVSTRCTARDASFDVDLKLAKIDYLSYVKLTKAILPAMLNGNKHGQVQKISHIVNISSLAGKAGVGLRTAYCGAKFALMGWFDALRVEEFVLDSGVCVTNVCPGSVRTNISQNAVMANANESFGAMDVNIANGLNVQFTCERILSGVSANLEEVWVAGPREMFLLYVMQYVPTLGKHLVKLSARNFMADGLRSKKQQ